MFRGVVCLAGVNRVLLKPLTRPPARCSGCVWSSAVNHRFDFAYLEDAVTRANSTTTTTTTLCLPLSSPLPPSLLPYTYQLLRSLLILSLPCLYLAVRTKPKPARPPHSINGISAASLFLFFLLHMSTGFFFLFTRFSHLHFLNVSQFAPFVFLQKIKMKYIYEKQQTRCILIFNGAQASFFFFC